MPSRNEIEFVINSDDQASDDLESIGERLDRLGSSIAQLGIGITTLTQPLTDALGMATTQAVDFNESITNTAAVLGLTADEASALGDQLLSLGMNAREGPQAVADAYYDIAGGVADATQHIPILNAAIQTSEAGAASLTSTTAALVSIMNSYGLSADQAALASDVLTRTVGMGVGTMDEFAGAFPMVTGLANTLGISLEDLGGMMAFITTRGYTASEASTQLRAAMNALLNPNADMIDALALLGVESGSAAIAQWGLAGTLGRLQDALGGSQDAMMQVLGSSEAMAAATSLNQESFESFITSYISGVEGATLAAQAIQLSSPAAQMDLLRSTVSALAIEVGNALIPALIQVMDFVRPLVVSIIDWVQANPELTAGIGIVVTVLGVLGTALTIAGTMIAAIGTVLGVLMGPIGLVIGGVAALGLAWTTNFGGIQDLLGPVVDNVIAGLTWFTTVGIPTFIEDLNNLGLVGAIQAALGWGENADSWVEGVLVNFGMSRDAAEELVNTMYDGFMSFVDFVNSTILPNLQLLADWFINDALPVIVSFITDTAAPAIEGFFSGLADFWADIQPGLQSLFDWFVTDALPLIVQFVSEVVIPTVDQFIENLGTIWAIVEPALAALFNWFTAEGLPAITDFISNTVMPILTTMVDILSTIWDVVSIGLLALQDWWTNTGGPNITNFINDVLNPAVDLIGTGIENMWTLVQPLLQGFYNWFDTNFPGITRDFIQPLITSIQDIVTAVTDAITAIQNMDEVWSGISDNANTIVSGVQSGEWSIGDIWNAVGNAVGSEISGHDYRGGYDANTPYMVGTGAQPELFMPSSSGVAIPNFDRYLNGMASGQSGGSTGDTYQITVQIQGDSSGDVGAYQMQGDTIGERLEQKLRRR